MRRIFERIGTGALRGIDVLGSTGLFLIESVAQCFVPPYRPLKIVEQIHFVGVKSLFVIILTASFTGMVLAIQGFHTLRKFGADGLLGSVVALSLIRELGPVLTALMVIGRAGSAMTAEIGILRIGGVIMALDAMAIEPRKFLVSPRLVGSVVAVPLLTAIFIVVGILGGWIVGVGLLGVNVGDYFGRMEQSVEFSDILGGLWKSFAFAVLIGWVCTWKGYNTQRGAKGVGAATTSAVVVSSVLVLVSDYILTSVLL
jgi:phospholipid/cholesterol/gamma-HCH transport system permease protein